MSNEEVVIRRPTTDNEFDFQPYKYRHTVELRNTEYVNGKSGDEEKKGA